MSQANTTTDPPAGRRMLIAGEWCEAASGATFDTRNPTSGAVIAEPPSAGREDVDRAVAAARAALPGWEALGGRERGRLLARLADLIEEQGDPIARLESTDNGRPLRETRSQARIVAGWFRYFAGLADKIEGATIPVEGPYLNYTTRVPVGVCAAITPWNHPLLIASKKLAPALACGNTVVLKPSELAPLSLFEFARLADEAGLPGGVLNVLGGARATGEFLATHPGVDRIDVTGSTATGIAVGMAAAQTLKRIGLELGGKAANVVFADADLERSARGAVFAGFIAQGQTCVAGARLLVERTIAEELAELVSQRLARIRIGEPLDESTQMGPLITPEAASRTAEYVRGAVEEGASLRSGGGPPAGLAPDLSPDAFYSPTLLWTDDAEIRAAQEEVFGPVVTLIPFADEDEAIAIANSVRFGLGSAVWTRDVSRAHRVATAIRAGVVWINDYHRIDPASPWGGFKLSGYGRENGLEAVREFTEVKSTWVPLEEPPIDWYESDDFERRLG